MCVCVCGRGRVGGGGVSLYWGTLCHAGQNSVKLTGGGGGGLIAQPRNPLLFLPRRRPSMQLVGKSGRGTRQIRSGFSGPLGRCKQERDGTPKDSHSTPHTLPPSVSLTHTHTRMSARTHPPGPPSPPLTHCSHVADRVTSISCPVISVHGDGSNRALVL